MRNGGRAGGALVPFPVRVGIMVRAHAAPLGVVLAAAGLLMARQWFGTAGDPERLAETLRSGRFIMSLVVPLIVGGVCGDLSRSSATLWMQKPVRPVRFYLARLGEAATIAVAFPAALTLLAAAATAFGDPDSTSWRPFLATPSVALLPLCIVAIGFGMSAWLPRAGRVAALAFVALSLVVEIQVALSMTSPEPPSPGPLRRMLLPTWAFFAVSDFIRGASPPSFGPIAWIFGYMAAWVALGTLGVRYSATRIARLRRT